MIILGLAALLLLALLASGVKLPVEVSQPQPSSAVTDIAAVVVAAQPVGAGESLVVCAAPVRRTPTGYTVVNAPVDVRVTTDQYRYDSFTLPGPGCAEVRPTTVVTNQMWVYVSSGGVTREFKLGAAGRIMLATDELIAFLVVLNVAQSAVIAFLALKVSGKLRW